MSEILKVSHSQLGQWSRCRFKWHIGYQLGWTTKTKSSSLKLGSLTHDLLAVFYNLLLEDINKGTTRSFEEYFSLVKEYVKTKITVESEYDLETISSAMNMVERYILDFVPFNDGKWRPVVVEKFHEVEMTTPQGRPFILVMYIDLIMQNMGNGSLHLWEHKTVGGGKFWTDTEVMMDNQTPTYIAALRQSGVDIKGIMFNMLNTYQYKDPAKQPIEKFIRRIQSHRSNVEIDSMVRELGNQVDDIYDNKDNPFRSLSRDCSYCWFQEPCLLEMKGVPLEDSMEFNFRKKESFQEEDTTNESE